MLQTDIPEGGPVGKAVANYIFRFVDGDEIVVPIRERFQTAAGQAFGPIPAVPGEPYVAVPDRGDSLVPRYAGDWGRMPQRQMESIPGAMKSFYLWAWTNPSPDRAIESVTLVPLGPKFLVAAIILGHLDEHPFARQRRREVRLELKNTHDARKQFDLEVEVDRGAAIYVHALPEASAEDFLADTHRG